MTDAEMVWSVGNHFNNIACKSGRLTCLSVSTFRVSLHKRYSI
jgi:hypothetical protein